MDLKALLFPVAISALLVIGIIRAHRRPARSPNGLTGVLLLLAFLFQLISLVALQGSRLGRVASLSAAFLMGACVVYGVWRVPKLPRFRVRTIEHDPIRLVGTLSTTRYGSQTWVQAGGRGDLRARDRFVAGRWSQEDSEWVFTPECNTALETIGAARELPVFDGYWGERAELVLDRSRNWSESTSADPEDHDHCRICWATLGSRKNMSHFSAPPALRVCPSCYYSYVQPRSIDFSRLGGPAA